MGHTEKRVTAGSLREWFCVQRFKPCRNDCWTLAALLLSAAVYFHPLVLHPSSILVGIQRRGENDVTSYFLALHNLGSAKSQNTSIAPSLVREPNTESTSEASSAIDWNPYSFLGHPVRGNPQAAKFYPPNWLYRILPASIAMSWVMVAHHVWGGLGTLVVCRVWGFGRRASLVGGVIFQGAPFFVAQLGEGHYNQVCVASWLPWLLWGYERFRTDPRKNLWQLVVVSTFSFFCGHVQEVYYLTLILIGFGMVDLWSLLRDRRRQHAVMFLAAGTLAACFTIGVIAVDLFPALAYVRQSLRSSGIDAAYAGGIQLASFQELWNPFVHGGPATSAPPRFYWETVCYFGIVPLLLAIAGTFAASQIYPVVRIRMAALISFLFAFGSNNPLFPAIYRWVPGMSNFREPGRILFLVSLFVAILAAAAIEWFCRRYPPAAQKDTNSQSNQPSWFVVALPIIVMSACVFELAGHCHAILRRVPQENIRKDNPIAEFLASNAEYGRVIAPQDLLSDDEAWSRGIFKVQAYEPVPVANVAAMFQTLRTIEEQQRRLFMMGFSDIALSDLSPEFVALLGVRFVVTRPQPIPENSPWQLVARGTVPVAFRLAEDTPRFLEYQIVEYQQAMPRAFVVGQSRRQTSAKEDSAMVAALGPIRETVLLETDDVLPTGPRSEFRPAQIVDYSSQRVTIQVDLPHPGYLVLADTFAAGWKATVNGQTVSILQANLGCRAVPLLAGPNRVEFEYHPPGFVSGIRTSLASILALVGIQLVLWRRRASPEATSTVANTTSDSTTALPHENDRSPNNS